jgi:excisionase family DNA binding protein
MPLEDLRGIITDAVSKTVSQAVSEEFNKRGIKEEKAYEYLTRQEVAKKLGVTLPTLWDWTKKGKIQGAHIGSRVRYRASDVEAALKNMTTKH